MNCHENFTKDLSLCNCAIICICMICNTSTWYTTASICTYDIWYMIYDMWCMILWYEMLYENVWWMYIFPFLWQVNMESSMPSGSRCLSGSRCGTADGKTKRGKCDKSIQKPSIFLGISVVYIFEIFWTLEISAVNWFLSPVAFPSCYCQAVCRRLKAACRQCGRIFEPGDLENWQTQQPMREVEKLGPDGQRFGSTNHQSKPLMNSPFSFEWLLFSGNRCRPTSLRIPEHLWILRSDVVEWIQSSFCDRQKDSQKWHVWGFPKMQGFPNNHGFSYQKWSALGVWNGGVSPFQETPIYIVIVQIPKVEYSMFKVISI